MVSRVPVALAIAALALSATGIAVAVQGGRDTGTAAGVPALSPTSTPAPVAAEPVVRPTSVPVAARPVAPLKALKTPDLLVTLPAGASRAQLQALRALPGLTGLAVLDTGTVHVGAFTASAVGVDPGQLRPFTPQETATSDPLWAAVQRGDLASSYALARTRHLVLGRTLPTSGAASVPLRLGAEATFGLPGADLVVERTAGKALGLVPASEFLVTAPSVSVRTLRRQVRTALGATATSTTLRPQAVTAQKPRTYRELFMASAHYCPGLSWTVLAAIGQIESNDGQNDGPSSAGALGPMQFLPSTWAYAGVDGDGDGQADINDPFDAVPAAALYLCRDGAGLGGQSLYDAVFSYNHADSYVQSVLGLAAKYH